MFSGSWSCCCCCPLSLVSPVAVGFDVCWSGNVLNTQFVHVMASHRSFYKITCTTMKETKTHFFFLHSTYTDNKPNIRDLCGILLVCEINIYALTWIWIVNQTIPIAVTLLHINCVHRNEYKFALIRDEIQKFNVRVSNILLFDPYKNLPNNRE